MERYALVLTHCFRHLRAVWKTVIKTRPWDFCCHSSTEYACTALSQQKVRCPYLFAAREKTIAVPSSYTSEFPRSSPISILLGSDTWPDVAGPLTSRVSFLTGRLDCSSQRKGGGVVLEYRRYIHDAGSTPLLLDEQLSYSANKTSMPSEL